MRKSAYWKFGNAALIKPWARPTTPVSFMSICLVLLPCIFVPLGIRDVIVEGDPVRLSIYLALTVYIALAVDKPWLHYLPSLGKRRNTTWGEMANRIPLLVLYCLLFQWYLLGILYRLGNEDAATRAHYMPLAGYDASWYIMGVRVPKPWRSPDEPITWKQCVGAFFLLWAMLAYVIVGLFLLGGVVYELVTWQVDEVLPLIIVLCGLVFWTVHDVWKALIRDDYHSKVSQLNLLKRAFALVRIWMLLLIVYAPVEFFTLGRWQRRWKNEN